MREMQSTSHIDGQQPWQSTPFDPKVPVRTTDRLDPIQDRRALNQYNCGDKIGGGSNGEIFACRDTSDPYGYPLVSLVFKFLTALSSNEHFTGCEGCQEGHQA